MRSQAAVYVGVGTCPTLKPLDYTTDKALACELFFRGKQQ